MRHTLYGALLATLSLAPIAGAQAPSIDSSAVAVRSERLPVLFDDGTVIPEQIITQTMKPFRMHWWRTVPLTLTSMVVASLVWNRPGYGNCDIYDPCSERTRYLSAHAPVIGFVVGATLSMAWNAADIVDREKAVRQQRIAHTEALRRAASTR